MPISVNVGGIWKKAIPIIKVDNIWKEVYAYVNVSGTWRPLHKILEGIFGSTSGVSNTLIEKYIFSTESQFAGHSLNTDREYSAAAGNIDVGIFAGGLSEGVSTEKYNFNNDSVSYGSNISVHRTGLVAIANSTEGIFLFGDDGTNYNDKVDRYNFSTNIVTSATVLPYVGTTNSGAVGNSTIGIVAGGHNPYDNNNISTRMYSYTYSTQIVWIFDSSPHLNVARGGLAAAGNTTFGIFAGGYDTSSLSSTEKYVYGTSTVSFGTSLTEPRANMSAINNSIVGVFGTGVFQSSHAVNKYIFSNDSVITGVTLMYDTVQSSATSNCHGGLY